MGSFFGGGKSSIYQGAEGSWRELPRAGAIHDLTADEGWGGGAGTAWVTVQGGVEHQIWKIDDESPLVTVDDTTSLHSSMSLRHFIFFQAPFASICVVTGGKWFMVRVRVRLCCVWGFDVGE